MRYMVEKNFVRVVGGIWQPGVGPCAMERSLSSYDVRNIGEFTRDNVQKWVDRNMGDFQSITDFYATVGDEEIPWADEENELTFNDCMYGNDN